MKRLLFSYANSKALFRENEHLYLDKSMNIIVDSGAFSAWTKGKDIDVREYIEFCERVLSLSSANLTFINLDVIPGKFRRKPTRQEVEESASKGWRHFGMMVACNLPVMHVFHQHEDFQWLKDLASASDYIGVSPANDVSPKERRRWLCRVFDVVGSGVKTHGFGVTTTELMELFPFYSVDSSSWLAPSLYGAVSQFVGLPESRLPGILSTTKDLWEKNFDLIAPHFLPSSVGYKYVTKLSLQAYSELERYVTDLWNERGVSWETSQRAPQSSLRQIIVPRSRSSQSSLSGQLHTGPRVPRVCKKRNSG